MWPGGKSVCDASAHGQQPCLGRTIAVGWITGVVIDTEASHFKRAQVKSHCAGMVQGKGTQHADHRGLAN